MGQKFRAHGETVVLVVVALADGVCQKGGVRKNIVLELDGVAAGTGHPIADDTNRDRIGARFGSVESRGSGTGIPSVLVSDVGRGGMQIYVHSGAYYLVGTERDCRHGVYRDVKGRVVLASEAVDDGERDGLQAGCLRRDALTVLHPIARKVESIQPHVITPSGGHQFRAQSQLPFHDIAIVVRQHILYLDVPDTVERASDQ